MRACLLFLLFSALFMPLPRASEIGSNSSLTYVIPVRDDIAPPLVYLIRRGVKDAMEQGANLLILDMETNGGRVDTTEEIIQILGQFKGTTVTFVNKRAFSAGAFISVATQKIYMAPQSVIGAAAPIMMVPGGGPQDMSETVEAKMTSAIRGLVRTSAEKNGHNIAVIEAMIDKNKELKIGDEVLSEKGQILTLTNTEAEKEYGDPPKPLLSLGTVESIPALIKELGFPGSKIVRVEPTGVETLGSWLNKISPLLLMIGIIGIYVEMKTPGFGLAGTVGLVAFAFYFLGGYIAGLSGLEWLMIFIIGLALVIVEIFLIPGTMIVGLIGAGLVLVSLIMALVDIYPGVPVPKAGQLQNSIEVIMIALAGSTVAIFLLARFMTTGPLGRRLVSQGASGDTVIEAKGLALTARMGQVGAAVSPLRPGGKAQFGEEILDVVSLGEWIPKGASVRIVGQSGTDPVVEQAGT